MMKLQWDSSSQAEEKKYEKADGSLYETTPIVMQESNRLHQINSDPSFSEEKSVLARQISASQNKNNATPREEQCMGMNDDGNREQLRKQSERFPVESSRVGQPDRVNFDRFVESSFDAARRSQPLNLAQMQGLLSMRLLNLKYPNNHQMQTDESIEQALVIQNDGLHPWPEDTHLVFSGS